MKYYAYEDFKQDTKKLIKRVEPLNIDAIVGISRGGLTLAHCMAEGLSIRNVQTLRTELYDDTQKRENITIHNNCTFENVKKVLVVDDISDSGETFKAVMIELEEKHLNIDFISATLFYKETSIYEPDFWVNDAKEWMDFFWTKDFE